MMNESPLPIKLTDIISCGSALQGKSLLPDAKLQGFMIASISAMVDE